MDPTELVSGIQPDYKCAWRAGPAVQGREDSSESDVLMASFFFEGVAGAVIILICQHCEVVKKTNSIPHFFGIIGIRGRWLQNRSEKRALLGNGCICNICTPCLLYWI